MGKFKIGDKVKFLSSQGGGIIRSFAATNVANVEDESGFEIPTLVSDLYSMHAKIRQEHSFALRKRTGRKKNRNRSKVFRKRIIIRRKRKTMMRNKG